MTTPVQLTRHFSLAEATKTSQPYDNSPEKEHYPAILHTAAQLERVRSILGNKPIIINSWYRSPRVNAAVGGVSNSQHALGEAVDFVCPRFGSPYSICLHLADYANVLGYDQLILEPTWVHISFSATRARKQNLTKPANGGYLPGIRQL